MQRRKEDATLALTDGGGTADVNEDSGTSIVDLLRFIRNVAHHYHELAPEVRMAIGPREELGNFWVSTFPLLLTRVHAAMHQFARDTNCARIKQFYC